MVSSQKGATELLVSASQGSEAAAEKLVPLIYDELRAIASAQLRRERVGHTLQTTALVHETYLKLIEQRRTDWKNRAHFFAIAATVTRRVLVDHARASRSEKRGGQAQRVTLRDDQQISEIEQVDLLDLHEALTRLESYDKVQAQVVELKFFCDLTIDECAEVLGFSARKVSQEWRMARAWLWHELEPGEDT